MIHSKRNIIKLLKAQIYRSQINYNKDRRNRLPLSQAVQADSEYHLRCAEHRGYIEAQKNILNLMTDKKLFDKRISSAKDDLEYLKSLRKKGKQIRKIKKGETK